MNAFQPASYMVSSRSPLGELAIVTCLVGGVATFGPAGSAIPVGQIHFAEGWNSPAPATAGNLLPSTAASQAGSRPVARNDHLTSTPGVEARSIRAAALVAPRERSIGGVRVRSLADSPALAAADLPTPVAIEAPKVVAMPAPVVSALPSAEAGTINLAVAQTTAEEPVAVPDRQYAAAPAPQPGSVEAQVGPRALPVRIIAVPELHGFDLALLTPGTRQPLPAIADPTIPPAPLRKTAEPGTTDKLVDGVVYHRVALSIGGLEAKSVDVRIGPDMKPSIKVGDLLGLVADRMDPDSVERFSAATATGEYVSFATLRASGFDVSYNAGADSIGITAAD